MLLFKVCGYCIELIKDQDNDSLFLLVFRSDVVNAIFLKYSKGDRLFSSQVGIGNIASDVCYDDTKHYQVQPEKPGRCKVCKKNSRRLSVQSKST